MKYSKKIIASVFATILIATNSLAKEDYTMPIENFSVLPVITSVQVSPNGKKLAMVRATTKNGDYIIEIRGTEKLDADPVRLGSARMEIQAFSWLNDKQLLVNFRQNIQDGNRNYWVTQAAVVNASGKGSWKVPFQSEGNPSYQVLSTLPQDPEHILISYDINDNFIPDVVKYNVNSGATKTILRGTTKVSGGFIVDMDGEVRAAQGAGDNGSVNLYARLKGDDEWVLVKNISPENRETFDFLGFSESPNEVYVNATNGNDVSNIYLYNLENKTFSDSLFGLKSVDAGSVILSSKPESRGQLVGFGYTAKYPSRYFIDDYEHTLHESVQASFKDKFIRLASRSNDDSHIVVYTEHYNDPGSYYLLRDKKEMIFLGNRAPLLEKEKLAKVRYVSYPTRDGKKVKAYVTVPNGKPPFKTVVMPHGGPWVRDVTIFDEWSQLLANNGFLVIQPQYRGSTGYGLQHWTAGDKQWGLKMQDDKDDAALWLVEKGLADKDKLAMFGWSYGGYAAFAASMREDNIYKCTVAGAGVSDLNRINATLSSNRFLRILQRPTIKGISPLDQVEKVNVPIMVVHGDIDQRVPVEHSRLFVDQLKELGKEHKYLELEGADHFSNTLYYEHKIEFYTELVNFLQNRCFQ